MIHSDNLPTRNHDDDVIVLSFLGNQMFKKESHRKLHGTFHYIAPKLLDDQGVNDLVAKIGSIVQKIRKVFDGRVVLIGPIPRLLENCCTNKAHHFSDNPLFNTTLQYAFLLNKFLAVHHGMNLNNFDFITYDTIFGNIFNELDLVDGVHLTADKNAEFANFIAGVTTLQVKRPKYTFNPNPSFLTWVEGIKMGAKNLFNKKAATQARKPPAAKQPQKVQTSDASPPLRQAPNPNPNPNAMDTSQPSEAGSSCTDTNDSQGASASGSKNSGAVGKAAKAAAGALNKLKAAFKKQQAAQNNTGGDLADYDENQDVDGFDAAYQAADLAGLPDGENPDPELLDIDDEEEGEIPSDTETEEEANKVLAGCIETGQV